MSVTDERFDCDAPAQPASGTTRDVAIVMAEDRGGAEIGLMIAIASLGRFRPDLPIYLYRPASDPKFEDWLADYPQVTLLKEWPQQAKEWNCKPFVLREVLDRGYHTAIWLDSDVLIARDFSALFRASSADELIVTEEPLSICRHIPDCSAFANAWGLSPAQRRLPVLNSCVVKVTSLHRPLLARWSELLMDQRYTSLDRSLDSRPVGFRSDQDVLAGLLASKEFESVPVRLLKNGREMLHSGGGLGVPLGRYYTGLFREVPPILHACAGKPWYIMDANYEQGHSARYTRMRRLLQEVSPFVAECHKLTPIINVPMPWLDRRSWLGWSMRACSFGHWSLGGLPVWTIAAGLDFLKRRVRGR